MKFKKYITLGSIVAISSTIPLVAQSCKTEIKKPQIKSNRALKFGEKTFDSEIEFVKFLRKNVKTTFNSEIKDGFYLENKKKQFITLYDLNKYLNSKIKHLANVQTLLTKEEIYKSLLNTKELSNFVLEKMSFDKSDENIQVFLGKDDVAYKTEQEAKASYINYSEFYFLLNEVFENKDQIYNKIKDEIENVYKTKPTKEKDRSYKSSLIKIFGSYKTKNIIKAPDGKTSFNVDFNKNGDLLQFVRTNLKKFILINGKYIDFNKILENPSKYFKLNDFSYIRVRSNQGMRTYLIDNEKNDIGNLSGPYILKSSGNQITSITNHKNWKETNNTSVYNNFTKNINQSKVDSFVTNVMFIDNNYRVSQQNDPNLISNYSFKKDTFSILKLFNLRDKIDKLKEEFSQISVKGHLYITLWDKINEITDFMNKGKRGTSFNQIMAIYIASLNGIVKYKGNNQAIVALRSYMKSLFEYIDISMRSMLGDLYVDEYNQPFDLSKNNKILDPEFDINTSYSYFINLFANSKIMIEAINVFNAATNNVTQANSLYEFSPDVLEHKDYDEDIINKFKNLYNKFSMIKDSEYGKFDVKKNRYGLLFDIATFQYEVAKAYVKGLISIANSGISQLYKNLGKALTQTSKINIDTSRYDNTRRKQIQTFTYIKQTAVDTENSVEFKDKIKSLDVTKDGDRKILARYMETETSTKFKVNRRTLTSYVKTNTIITELPSKADLAKKRYKKIQKAYQDLGNIFTGMNLVFDVFKTISQTNNVNYAQDVAKSVASLADFVMGFVPDTPVSIGVKMAVRFAFQFIIQAIGEKKVVNYQFIENSSGVDNKFVWDGGLRTIRFWGLSVENNKTMRDAKLLDPIKISDEQTVDSIYFNKKLYNPFDISTIINDALIQISKGDFSLLNNGNNLIKYSFDNEIDPNKIIEHGFSSITNSVDEYINNIKSTKGLEWFKKRYLDSSVGYIKIPSIDNSHNEKYLATKNNASLIADKYIDNLKSTLKPVLVYQTPNLYNGVPIDQVGIKYKLYLSYNELLKYYRNKEKHFNDRLFVYDLNLRKNNGYIYDLTSDKKLYFSNFINSFNVKNKLVSKRQFHSNSVYSKLKPIENIKIYYVHDSNNRVHYFTDYYEARKILLSSDFLGLKVIKYEANYNKMYEFNGVISCTFEKLVKKMLDIAKKQSSKKEGENV